MYPKEKREIKRFSTFRIVGGYLLFGVLWIVFSDNVLMMVSPTLNSYQHLQTYKGLFYVIATAFLLLGLVKREFRFRDAMETRLKQSLTAQEELSRELHHRVKNNLQLMQSLLNLQREKVRSSGRQSDANELLRRVSMRMQVPALFHQKIYALHEESIIPLKSYIEEIVGQFNTEYRTELSEQLIRTDLDRMSVKANRAVPIGVIVGELLMNVVNHAFSVGKASSGVLPEVVVRGRVFNRERMDESLVLSVEDNGAGFDHDHMRKGLGYALIETMLRQVDGDIQFLSEGKNVVEITIGTPHQNQQEVRQK